MCAMQVADNAHHERSVVAATVIDSNPGRHNADEADPSQISKAKDLDLICSYECTAVPQSKHGGRIIPSNSWCMCQSLSVCANPFNKKCNRRVVFQMTHAVNLFGIILYTCIVVDFHIIFLTS